MFRWLAAVLSTPHLVALAPAKPAGGQTVLGAVYEAESGLPIPTAEVVLLAQGDRVVGSHTTGENGLFVLRAPDPGSYRLRAGRIGYASFTTEAFTVEPDQSATVDLRLRPDPLLLDSLAAVVEGQRPSRLVRVGFYKRRTRGFGYFLAPEDIDDRRAVHPADLFWGIPGIRVVQRNAFDRFVVSTRWSGRLDGPAPMHPRRQYRWATDRGRRRRA